MHLRCKREGCKASCESGQQTIHQPRSAVRLMLLSSANALGVTHRLMADGAAAEICLPMEMPTACFTPTILHTIGGPGNSAEY